MPPECFFGASATVRSGFFEAVGGEHFFERLAIADAGWVDGAIVAGKYRTMRSQYPQGHDVYGDHVPALWMITAVELWFRAAFGAYNAPGAN